MRRGCRVKFLGSASIIPPDAHMEIASPSVVYEP